MLEVYGAPLKKTESEKYLKALYGGTLSMALPHGCFYAAVTEKCAGAPNHHSFSEEGHPPWDEGYSSEAGTLH